MWSQHRVAARVCLSFTNSFNSKLLLGARACKSLVQQLFWSCSSQACLEGAKNREMAELGVKTKGFTFKEEAGTLSGAGLSNLRGGQWDAGADVVGQGLSCSPKAGEGAGHARQGQDCIGVGCNLVAGKPGPAFWGHSWSFPCVLSGLWEEGEHSPFLSAFLLLGTDHPWAGKFCCGGFLEVKLFFIINL